MTDTTTSSQPAGTWPELRSGPLIAGGILIGIGAAVALAGVAVVGSHVVSATRAWARDLEIPPGQLARLKWEQAKSAAASGASTWREHPHAQARLARRAAAPGSE
jgi:hypothetical protein